jgi:menaquinone-dependent protoporphyrinogen oxidase
MRVLVAHGSRMGGTSGIAELVGDALTDAGGHWHRQARRFVKRHTGALRERPVWVFSSGPLNGAAAEEIPPVPQVQQLLELSLDRLGQLHA